MAGKVSDISALFGAHLIEQAKAQSAKQVADAQVVASMLNLKGGMEQFKADLATKAAEAKAAGQTPGQDQGPTIPENQLPDPRNPMNGLPSILSLPEMVANAGPGGVQGGAAVQAGMQNQGGGQGGSNVVPPSITTQQSQTQYARNDPSPFLTEFVPLTSQRTTTAPNVLTQYQAGQLQNQEITNQIRAAAVDNKATDNAVKSESEVYGALRTAERMGLAPKGAAGAFAQETLKKYGPEIGSEMLRKGAGLDYKSEVDSAQKDRRTATFLQDQGIARDVATLNDPGATEVQKQIAQVRLDRYSDDFSLEVGPDGTVRLGKGKGVGGVKALGAVSTLEDQVLFGDRAVEQIDKITGLVKQNPTLISGGGGITRFLTQQIGAATDIATIFGGKATLTKLTTEAQDFVKKENSRVQRENPADSAPSPDLFDPEKVGELEAAKALFALWFTRSSFDRVTAESFNRIKKDVLPFGKVMSGAQLLSSLKSIRDELVTTTSARREKLNRLTSQSPPQTGPVPTSPTAPSGNVREYTREELDNLLKGAP